MPKIYYIPIEPLEERYTAQWYKYFPEEFQQYGFDVEVIDGITLTNHVDVGAFLPMNSTVHYKCSQMQEVAKLFQEKKVQDDDIFFVADLEFWGIESIRLMSQLNNVPVKIYAFLHAASYTLEDAFAVAAPYQKYIEVGWAKMCDGIFVGSEYHKQAFMDRRIIPYATTSDMEDISLKIHVTGNPIFTADMPEFEVEKKKQIIISNRFDWEKRPNLSLDFCYILKKKHPDWNIIITTSRPKFKSNQQWLVDFARELEKDGILSIHEGLTKHEYYRMLAESKVMLTNSIEENFGYCIAEALHYNTYPLGRNALSHPELCQNNMNLLYDSEDQIVSKVESLMKQDYDVRGYIEYCNYAIDEMCNIMKYHTGTFTGE